jgi:tetratricopeptide (TPR) repeat protein
MNYLRTLALLLALSLTAGGATAQCVTWVDSPQKEDAENAHVAYRNFVKGKTAADLAALPEGEFNDAFNNWKIAYDIAPAADGNRPFHYRDGRMFYKAMRQKATDEAKKQEYTDMIFKLYDEELECYPKYQAFLLGRKGSDMFYLSGYSEDAIEVIEEAMDSGGNETEYVVLAPLGKLLNYYYQEDAIDNVRMRELYDKATNLADYNIENNETYAPYYQAGKDNLDADVLQFADEIFDCDYFKGVLLPKVDENRDSLDVLRYIVTKLKAQGCDSTDADVVRVQGIYDDLYAEKKEEYEAERRRMNPIYEGSELMKEGKYAEAVEAFERGIEATDDDEKKAQAYFYIAQIQNAELGQYGSARQNANKAAQLKPNWGKPYILIGDIYGRMSRNCSDSWDQRLAVLAAIDKYNQAKSIDSDVAGDANRRIGNYRSSMPIRSEAFQRGLEEGARLEVGCGIGETVTLRF